MPRPELLPICDDRAEVERHRWPDDWADGDTCHCGRWYLRRGTAGVGFEIECTRQVETEDEDEDEEEE
jgi:hypothetical protein